MTAELIARLEAAEAGSRELDAEIYQALRYQRGQELGLTREHIGVWRHLGGGIVESQGSRDLAMPVTTSLDAIVALIEEKLPGWSIASIGMADDKTWHCELRRGFTTSYDAVATSSYRTGCRPATAPLACTIALLRALSVQKGESADG